MAGAATTNASFTTTLKTSSSDQDDAQQQTAATTEELRKRKRMLSNRESARRSRMKKQKHLDDLMSQLGQLKMDNNEILTRVKMTTQLYCNLEAENSVLRAQVAELTHRLDSLNEIINVMNMTTAASTTYNDFGDYQIVNSNNCLDDDWLFNSVSGFDHRPIMDLVV